MRAAHTSASRPDPTPHETYAAIKAASHCVDNWIHAGVPVSTREIEELRLDLVLALPRKEREDIFINDNFTNGKKENNGD